MKKVAFCVLFCLLFSPKTSSSEPLENHQQTIQHVIDPVESPADTMTFGDVIAGFGYRPLDMCKNMIITVLGQIAGWQVKRFGNLKGLALYEYFSHIPGSYLFSSTHKEALSRPVYCLKDYVLLNILFLNGLIDVNEGEFDLGKFFHIDKQNPEDAILLGALAFKVQRRLAGILNLGVRQGHGNKVLISLSPRDQRKVYAVTLILLFARELANFGYYLIPEALKNN